MTGGGQNSAWKYITIVGFADPLNHRRMTDMDKDDYIKDLEAENEKLRARNEVLELAVDKFIMGRFISDCRMLETHDKAEYSARYSLAGIGSLNASIVLEEHEMKALVKLGILTPPEMNGEYINGVGYASEIPNVWVDALKQMYQKQDEILNKQEKAAKIAFDKTQIQVMDET